MPSWPLCSWRSSCYCCCCYRYCCYRYCCCCYRYCSCCCWRREHPHSRMPRSSSKSWSPSGSDSPMSARLPRAPDRCSRRPTSPPVRRPGLRALRYAALAGSSSSSPHHYTASDPMRGEHPSPVRALLPATQPPGRVGSPRSHAREGRCAARQCRTRFHSRHARWSPCDAAIAGRPAWSSHGRGRPSFGLRFVGR